MSAVHVAIKYIKTKLQTTRQLHFFFIFIKLCYKFNQQRKQKWPEIKSNVRNKKLQKQHNYPWIPRRNNI